MGDRDRLAEVAGRLSRDPCVVHTHRRGCPTATSPPRLNFVPTSFRLRSETRLWFLWLRRAHPLKIPGMDHSLGGRQPWITTKSSRVRAQAISTVHWAGSSPTI